MVPFSNTFSIALQLIHWRTGSSLELAAAELKQPRGNLNQQ